MTLDQHHQRYLTHPDHLDALLVDLTKLATSLAFRYGHPDPEAFAQDEVIRIWQMWPLPVRKSFGGYVYRLLMSRLKDDRRSRTKQRQIDVVQTDDREVSIPEYDDRDLSTLTGKRKQIAAMLVMGYTQQQVADALDCSTRTISRICRGTCPNAA